MRKTLKEKIVSVLKNHPGQGFKASDVADKIMEQYTAEYAEKGIKQLSKEVGAQFSRIKNPQIKVVPNSDPIKRYWDNRVTGFGLLESNIKQENKQENKREHGRKNRQGEKELYEPLQKFLYEGLGVKAFRINESASSNKGVRGSNKHRHPDLVGVEGMVSNRDYHLLVQQMYVEFNLEKAKIWSFEVKEKITAGTVRDCYNQAVSNSSWANWGFLCVGSIEGGEKTEKELSRLTTQGPIGIILINKEEPLKSEIYIDAIENTELNLEECSFLAKENTDFVKFLEYAINVYKTGKVY